MRKSRHRGRSVGVMARQTIRLTIYLDDSETAMRVAEALRQAAAQEGGEELVAHRYLDGMQVEKECLILPAVPREMVGQISREILALRRQVREGG